MEYKHYEVSRVFAQRNNLTRFFVGVQVAETEKAILLYGRCEIDPRRKECAFCMTELSKEEKVVGFCTPCLKNYRNVNYKEREQWFPKGAIFGELPKKEIVLPVKFVIPDKYKNGVRTKAGAIEKEFIVSADLFEIRFKYSAELIMVMHQLKGARYFPKGYYWVCDITEDNYRLLLENGFVCLTKDVEKQFKGKIVVEELKKYPISVPNGMELYPFQKEGVQFLLQKKGRALIGDAPGLGKTIQALTYLYNAKNCFPAILVCPSSLKLNWLQEAKKWLKGKDINIYVLSGRTPANLKGDTKNTLYIINYDIICEWHEELMSVEPETLILDECHKIKEPKIKRTKILKVMAKTIKHIIPMSGTPAINRPIELFTSLNMIDSHMFNNMWSFANRYCDAKHNGWGWDFTGASNMEELYSILQNYMIRRKKEEVLQDLPDKQRTYIPFEIPTEDDYWEIEDNMIRYISRTRGESAAKKANQAETLVRISMLRKKAVESVLKQSIEWMTDFLESTDEKIVIMAIHKDIIHQLEEKFKGQCVSLTGETPMNIRQKNVEAFQQNPKIRVFIGNIQAAGVGITLTKASNIIFLELPWTPGELEQAEDRVHRIGQKNAVTVWYLLAKDSIENKLAELLDMKRGVLTQILDGKEINEQSTLNALISLYMKK